MTEQSKASAKPCCEDCGAAVGWGKAIRRLAGALLCRTCALKRARP